MKMYKKLPVLVCYLAVFNLPATSLAGLFDDDEARKAIIELRGRVEIMNRDLLAKITDLSNRLERLETNDQASQRGRLEQQNQLEAMRKELADLRGKLEVQNNDLQRELSKTQLQLRELNAGIDSRFAALEPRFTAADARQAAADARVKKLEPSTVGVTIDDKIFSVTSEEKNRFDTSLSLLKASDFRSASVSFAQFLSAFPESPFAPQALVFQANSLFGLKDYRAAIATNERFIQRFPESPRAADALLQIGFSQIELNDRRTARTTLQSVAERFPNSDAAKQARERLTTLR